MDERTAAMFSRSRHHVWGAFLVLMLLAACVRQEPERLDCDIDAGPCRKTVEGLKVTLDITPKPVRAMRELSFLVILDRAGEPLEHAQVSVDLSMPGMEMGRNVVRLAPEGGGRYAGKGVIVRCPSGRTDWKAAVTVSTDRRTTGVAYLLSVP